MVDLRWLAPLPHDEILRHAHACGRVLVADECRATGAGIADALIATAAGLAAAIPAAYFYNHLTNHVKRITSEMDDFAMEFLTITERNFT